MKESSWPRCHLVHVTVPMSVWFTSIHPMAALPCTHWWPNKADGQRNWLAVLSAFPSHPFSLQMKGWCNQFCAFVCSVDSCSVNGSPLSPCLSLPRPIEMAFLCDVAGCGSSPLLCSPLDPSAGHSVWEPCAASLRPWQKRIIQISQLLLEETLLSLSLLLFGAAMDYCCWLLVNLEDGGEHGLIGHTWNPSIVLFSQSEQWLSKRQNKSWREL